MNKNELKDNNVYVNEKTYEFVVANLKYVPLNLKINPHLEDNQAVVFGAEMECKPYMYHGG